jgi:integrase
MSHQDGLGDNGPQPTGLNQPDDGDDHMQKKSENVAHAEDGIRLRKLKNSGRLRNSPPHRANEYQPLAVKTQMMGKASTPFSVFAARWQTEVLVHKKASTAATIKGHINGLLIPVFGNLAIGDLDSERVQSFLNRLMGKASPKTVKNVWTTLRIMWNSAVAWKYVTGELRVELPKARKLRMRCYAVEEVKRILVHTKGADRVFFWLAAESGLRAGELIALRASDVDVEKLSVEVTKAIWNGSEDNPKTEAAFRSVCISSRLGSQVKEYLAGRTDGYLFQTSSGNPWGASNVLERKLNTVLDERNAAEKLGELFGTGWPEIDKGKVISFPNLSQKEEGPPIGVSEALANQ